KAVHCADVTKCYGELRAVDGISLDIEEGEIFGMIGPNGAGKTTLMECVEGMRTRDSGVVEVLGLDPQQHPREVRRRTGLQLQSAALPRHIKTGEALELFSSFYNSPLEWRPLLSRLGLADKVDSYVEKLSGGQRQRVFIALALLNEPGMDFLDALTTGLDPKVRLAMSSDVRTIRGRSTYVHLTIHNIEVAQSLC